MCHSTCETCQGGTENSCLTCAPPLLLQDGGCVAVCGAGVYQEAGRCAPCLHACTACVSRLNCTACAPGLRLQSGECRASCAPGYYSDRGLCSKCYLSCQTCRWVLASQSFVLVSVSSSDDDVLICSQWTETRPVRQLSDGLATRRRGVSSRVSRGILQIGLRVSKVPPLLLELSRYLCLMKIYKNTFRAVITFECSVIHHRLRVFQRNTARIHHSVFVAPHYLDIDCNFLIDCHFRALSHLYLLESWKFILDE